MRGGGLYSWGPHAPIRCAAATQRCPIISGRHEVFVKERSAPRVDHVTFGLSVGTAVPRSVRIVAVPQTIIEIQPTWRGYEYFMVGDGALRNR